MTTSPPSTPTKSDAGAALSAKHTTLLAEILVPLLIGLFLLLVGAALYRRHKKKQEQTAAVPYPYPPMQERGATHGADVSSTAPTVGHGYSNLSVNHSTTAPTLGHGHSNSSVNHSTTNHVYAQSSVNHSSFVTTTITTLPLARVRTHSVCYHDGGGTRVGYGYGYGYARTYDGHSVFADSPFESESPLHW
ncbi:hypothetical protein B0H13DRAFT_2333989 [Mycena leptocephala]|nr:hypothetical protein B0H13DRAFT_2333989 [Mycena leptocephala]